MYIKEVETDGRPHIIKEFFVTIDLNEDDQKDLDEDYIRFYFEGDYPNKDISVMFLSNSPCNFQDGTDDNPNEEWYEVTIMEPDEKLNTLINSI